MRREVPVNQSRGVYLAFVGSWINPLALQTREPLSCSSVYSLIFCSTQKHNQDKAEECVAPHCKGQSPLLISFNYYLYSTFVSRWKSNNREEATVSVSGAKKVRDHCSKELNTSVSLVMKNNHFSPLTIKGHHTESLSSKSMSPLHITRDSRHYNC